MEILYIAHARIPTEKAHGLQIAKMCEAYAALGHEVTLVVPNRKNHILIGDVFSYYGVKKNFEIIYLPIISFLPVQYKFFYRIIEISFLVSLFIFLRKRKNIVVITRDIFVTLFFGNRFSVFYEMHDFSNRCSAIWKKALSQATGVIVTNIWKKEAIVKKFNVAILNIHVAPNGYDPNIFFSTNLNKREELHLENDKFVLCYAGMLKTLGADKGVKIAISSLERLPKNIILLLLGGSLDDIRTYTEFARNLNLIDRIVFVGRVKHNEMREYLSCADVCIAPFPDTSHYRYYMSPIKLFEYMAMAKPIFASDLPSIREILGEDGVYHIPDDEKDFTRGVISMQKNVNLRHTISIRLSERAKKFTWEERAKGINQFIQQRL